MLVLGLQRGAGAGRPRFQRRMDDALLVRDVQPRMSQVRGKVGQQLGLGSVEPGAAETDHQVHVAQAQALVDRAVDVPAARGRGGQESGHGKRLQNDWPRS